MPLTDEIVAEVESSVKDREVIGLARELIMIPSVYGREAEISRFIHEKFRSWGMSPEFVEVAGYGPDVVVSYGPRRLPSIVFNGHMDTVDVMQGWKHDPFGAEIENGVLYGLGALDMKSGLACMMAAFRAAAETSMTKRRRLVFQAVSAEEATGAGTRALVDAGNFDGAEAVIVGEGIGGLGVITNGRRGGSYYDIEFRGKAAHGAEPERGINAVVDASKAVAALSRMKMRCSKGLKGEDRRLLTESQTVLRMSGGGDSLSVPDNCVVRLMRSTVPGATPDVGPAIRSAIRRLGIRSRVKVNFLDTREHLYHAFVTSPDDNLVKVAMNWVYHCTGTKPELVCGRSEADDNVIAREAGVPVISLGPGERGALAKYHQAEEAISTSQLGLAARIYALIALDLLQ